jgi:hypothetical protein
LPHSIVYFSGVRQNTQAYFVVICGKILPCSFHGAKLILFDI